MNTRTLGERCRPAGCTAVIGAVHEESYILVHEVPAAAYGCGGKTQEHRDVTSELAAAAAA